jgi:hypothetical protein
MRNMFLLKASLAMVLAPIAAHATIIYSAYYQLGESDPGAAPGNPGDAQTIDSSGNGLNLTKHNNSSSSSAQYSNNVPPFGSSLAMSFSGTGDYDGNVVTSAVNNFGIEAWVLFPSVPTGNVAIAYDGTTGSSGFGLYSHNGILSVLFGGVSFKNSSTAVVANTWTNLALVRNGGVDTLYINGVAQSLGSTAPLAAAGSMVIGANASHGENLTGNIDEVGVFTFTPGAFSTSDLLYNQEQSAAAAEPGAVALSALGLSALIAYRRRSFR